MYKLEEGRGWTEQILGRGSRKAGIVVVLATKVYNVMGVGPMKPAVAITFARACEESLRRTATDLLICTRCIT